VPHTDSTCVKISLEEAFKTASHYGDVEAGVVTNGPVYCHDLEASMVGAVDDTAFHRQNIANEDMLTSLRNRGSAIHRTILRMKVSDFNQRTVELPCDDHDAQAQWEMLAGSPQHFPMTVPFDHGSPVVPWYLPSCESVQQLPPPPPPFEIPPMAPVLRLAEAVPPPELGTPALPSIGSMLHHKKECKPCTFFHTRGCENAGNCEFCHLCGPGEKKKRLRLQRHAKREAKVVALDNARAILASYSATEECAESDMIIE